MLPLKRRQNNPEAMHQETRKEVQEVEEAAVAEEAAISAVEVVQDPKLNTQIAMIVPMVNVNLNTKRR